MSIQTKHRYINSFFIAAFLYLAASFFLFYVFADTLVVVEKKQEEVKMISLQHVDIKPTPPQPHETPSQPVIEEKPIERSEPIVEKPKPIHKKVEKPKPKIEKIEPKKVEKPIEKVAEQKNEVVPVQEVKPIETIPAKPTMSASEMQSLESEYLSKVRFHIEKNKTYPKVAKRLNQTGKVHVTFIILKDGKIKHCKVHKSSNFDSLDTAALEIFDKIVEFEPIPEKLDKNSWEITVPIVYQISRN